MQLHSLQQAKRETFFFFPFQTLALGLRCNYPSSVVRGFEYQIVVENVENVLLRISERWDYFCTLLQANYKANIFL